jgi:Ca2+-binding EF-hand superfamily protein
MRTIHLLAAASLLASLSGTLYAEPAGENASAFRERASAQIGERFRRGDANGDGKLSREEARTAMPRVYENFDRIDTEKIGYVTLDQIKQFSARLMAERRNQQGS